MPDADTAATGPGPLQGSSYPPAKCGRDLDLDPLWVTARADIIDVREPEKGKSKYVILEGSVLGTAGKYDKLLVPKDRITGIECPKIVQSDALNFWKYAWAEATEAFAKQQPDVLVGINSYDGRTREQLHIHLTALKRDLRPKLDALAKQIPSNLHNWNTSIFELGPSLNGKTYVYRIAHVDNLETNPFNLLDQYVSGKCQDRFAQSLAIVAGTHGYYLLTTQGQPTQTGQPQHTPDLSINGHYGTTTAEGLMDRNWS